MGFTSAGLPNGGKTNHFQISYDDSYSSADGLGRAQALMDLCEQDYRLMSGWFSGVNFEFSFPIPLQIENAAGGGSWSDPANIELPAGVSPTIHIQPGAGTSVNFIRYILVSEMTEMFMASQNKGWFESTVCSTAAMKGARARDSRDFSVCGSWRRMTCRLFRIPASRL